VSQKILVVDDEQSITDLLAYNLRRNGYQPIVAHDGHQALRLAQVEQPDLVILDLMLPGLDGLDVCRALQRESTVPIIMLTARDEEVDRVVGLELGADDYVTKPFSVRELMARVKAVLRRITSGEITAAAVHRIGLLEMDTLSREARLEGALLPLTRLEFDLLETLARHAGQVLSREQLLDQVWGYDPAQWIAPSSGCAPNCGNLGATQTSSPLCAASAIGWNARVPPEAPSHY
jgi:DNA-binding response OmpR family regulator